MHPDSPFYIERPEDQTVKDYVQQQGITVTLKGPRQVGKSSMLMQIEKAIEPQKQMVIINFSDFEQAILQDAETFFRQFCTLLSDELGLENSVAVYWGHPLGNPQRCTRYMGRYLLKQLERPLVLALKAVDVLFETGFQTEFFGMLRGWSDKRSRTGKSVWKQLDIILITSTEPYQFIKDLTISPFNVGLVIELSDFNEAQVAELNRRHRHPLNDEQVKQLTELVAGQPYLVRQALHWVASQRCVPDQLFKQPPDDDGPFGPHLRRLLRRLLNRPEQQAALKQVIQENKLDDEAMFFRLEGAGLARRGERSKDVFLRCPLYANYFEVRLYG